MLKIKLVAVILVVAAAGFFVYHRQNTVKQVSQKAAATAKIATAKADAAKAAAEELASHCAGNTAAQAVIVSISKRHMWVCESSKTVYDNPVITGMENLPEDLTPAGTYKIYAKQTDTVLKGCDTTGCWNDPVSYWMPFLSNNYGVYGFHDATWRAASDFGNIDPNSSNASHGCVEMPLAAAKWLYGWAPVGTTVTIQS
ncbi:MAG: L,D-transpeptidase [Candidatus Saccharimonadales bacterium]|jgi:lipoprotein-anchoring transpeptidase ErfK/SrfK